MSNEIRATANLVVSKNSLTATGNSSVTLDLTGSNFIQNVQVIGTSFEQVNFGDLVDCKALWLSNMATGSVTCSYDLAGTKPFCTLYPYGSKLGLSSALFTPHIVSQSVFLKADLPASDVQIIATES